VAICSSVENLRDPIVTEPTSPAAHSANIFALLIPPSFADVAFQSFNQLLMTVNGPTRRTSGTQATRRQSAAVT